MQQQTCVELEQLIRFVYRKCERIVPNTRLTYQYCRQKNKQAFEAILHKVRSQLVKQQTYVKLEKIIRFLHKKCERKVPNTRLRYP